MVVERLLSRMPVRLQPAMWLAAAIAAGGASYCHVEGPARQRIARLRQELVVLQNQNTAARAAAEGAAAVREEMAGLQARFGLIAAQTAGGVETADNLRRLHALAARAGLTIAAFRPLPAVEGDLYTEWPIALELEGTYPALGEFLARVATLPVVLAIDKLVATAKPAAAQDVTIAVSCLARIFAVAVEERVEPRDQETNRLAQDDAGTDPDADPGETMASSFADIGDPFLEPVAAEMSAAVAAAAEARPRGLGGVRVDEIAVRGILGAPPESIALVAVQDGRTFRLRAGDRLLDGEVRLVTPDAVVLMQFTGGAASNAGGLVVRKTLRERSTP